MEAAQAIATHYGDIIASGKCINGCNARARVHEDAMAARPKGTEVTQFRARPWPVPVGCKADLRAKVEVTTLSVEVDPALDFADHLEMLEWHIDLREYQRVRSSETVAPPRAGEDLPRHLVRPIARTRTIAYYWMGLIAKPDDDGNAPPSAMAAFVAEFG